MNTITFSTCFYILKSKFDSNTYISWMNNLISIVNNFYLIIYTDLHSSSHINTLNNPNIKIILKPIESFSTYHLKDLWISNHTNNTLLNSRITWEVNMLWNEKIAFVLNSFNSAQKDSSSSLSDSSDIIMKDTCFPQTDFYGWCDIGYFRNRPEDTNTSLLSHWPNPIKIASLDPSKIHYALINNDSNYLNYLFHHIANKNYLNLPSQPIPSNQTSVAGGFFIAHKSKLPWWSNTFYHKLNLYLSNNYLVKDDQIILIDCIFSQLDQFSLTQEFTSFDNWFMFQRTLA